MIKVFTTKTDYIEISRETAIDALADSLNDKARDNKEEILGKLQAMPDDQLEQIANEELTI